MSWPENLELAKKDSKHFLEKGEKIVKRFRDERNNSQTSNAERRYNILWSNIKTLFPAVYSRKPKAQVERRYKDQDPVGRTAAQILERALQYEIDHYPDYDSALRGCLLDRLLPGRGVAWIRFDAGDQMVDQVTDDVTKGESEDEGDEVEAVAISAPEDGISLLGLIPEETKKTDPRDYECTACDYVFWKDFRHSPARTWEEVTWVARRVYMTKEEVIKRFGEDAKDVPLTHEPIGLDKDATITDDMKKAVVWEIWDKTTKKVIWRAESYSNNLDEQDDPLGLECFFPCPKPLFATMTTDTLQPIADYLEYQDQAMELDDITQRISVLVKAVKAVGVYDASQTGVQRLMEEGTDNTLIPVENFGAFVASGGLVSVVQMLPIDTVIKALNELYKARDICKQVIYEVTGMSDILRGATDPNETYGAQKIKSQFGSLRVKEIQQDVSRFATDLLNLKAQLMGSLYRPETLIEMSGIMGTEDAQYAEQAIQLIQNESMRCYRIEIAADSMVELDEQAEKEARLEFLVAAGNFLEKAVQAAQIAPEIAPLMGEMLMFGVRSFKAARPIEAAFEQAVQKLSQPQPPKPNPEAEKAQGEAAKAQAKAQADIQIAQIDAQAKAAIAQAQAQAQQQTDMVRQQMEERQHAAELDMKARMDQMQASFDEQQSQRQMAFEQWKVMKQSETALGVAEINKATTMSAEQESAADNAARD
jgi:hypothetical protein